MTAILVLKAHEARTKDYRRTEMWLYLPKDQRPPEAYAQWASATVLRETYLTFALLDLGDRDRDVGSGAAVLAVRLLRRCPAFHFPLPINCRTTSRLCGFRRCSTR